jgi:GR25 family glycosyltransferase involved in LPS biosynthesis
MNNLFDKVIFINCKHRLDRLKNIHDFIDKFQLKKYHILEATYLPKNGAKGCSHSHYRAMCYAIENNLNNVLILEDDYFIKDDPDIINTKFKNIFNNKHWDVIMLWWLLNGLGRRSKQTEFNNHLHKIVHHKYGASSTLAYAVNKNMFSILRDLFFKSYNSLDDEYNHNQKKYKTDAIWHPIQKNYNWYIIVPKIGEQKETKSDVHCW